MNRLNPLYILGLFLTLLFISFLSLSNEKKAYFEKIDQVNQLQQKAQEYKALTSYWKNETFINKTIDEIMKNSMFKNEQITKTVLKEVVILKIESSNSQVLDLTSTIPSSLWVTQKRGAATGTTSASPFCSSILKLGIFLLQTIHFLFSLIFII